MYQRFSQRRRARGCALLLAALSVSVTSLAYAQDAIPGLGETPRAGQRVERIEVGGKAQTGTDLRRNAMVAKQVYGREELDKYGDTNALDVLKRLPGVNVQSGAPRMRGLGAGYTQILLNGDPAPPGFALDQLSPSQIERIEVTKGPTADQSAQAVAGSINIILKDAPRVSQRDLRLGVNYSVNQPTANANLTLGEKLGAVALSLPISLFQWRGDNRFATDRFMLGSDSLPAASLQVATQDFWGNGFNLGPRINWKIRDEETLSVQSFIQKGHWNNATAYRSDVLSGTPVLDDDNAADGMWENIRSNLQWINRFSDTQRIEIKVGVNLSEGTFDTRTLRNALPYLRTVGDNTDRGITQGGKYSQLLGDEHTLTTGWDLEWRRRDEERAVTRLGVPQLPEFEGQPFAARIRRTALFIQDEWELSAQWSTYFGLRSEQIRTESRGTGIDAVNVSRVLTPLWHINYKFDQAGSSPGRDMVRASITRSYKAPDLNALLARPALSSLYPDPATRNTELSPDRVGNPQLKPELALGLDVSYEKYLSAGGLVSIGFFHRSIDDLIRNVTTSQNTSWASVPRWVVQPQNFSEAKTSGVEFEIKGRAGELMPGWFDPKLGLNLRGSLSVYRSRVDALSGPDNRLDGQQPWSGNLGFDHRFAGWPLTIGATLGYTPGYMTQQTELQSLDQGRTRSLDVFAQWVFSRSLSLRAFGNNLTPVDTWSQTLYSSGYGSSTLRKSRTQFGAVLEIKL